MRHYEIVFLVNPDQSDQAPTIITKLSSIVTVSGGTVHRSENIGSRRLAYPIQDQFKAVYALLNIECGQTAIDEIKNSFKFNDSVIRNLILNTKEAHSDSSALLAQTREDSEKESYEEEKQRKYQEEKALKEKSRMKETARRAAEADAKKEIAEAEAAPEAEAKKEIAEAEAAPEAEAKKETEEAEVEAQAEVAPEAEAKKETAEAEVEAQAEAQAEVVPEASETEK
jgi:small subunit ribosomal protein S6